MHNGLEVIQAVPRVITTPPEHHTIDATGFAGAGEGIERVGELDFATRTCLGGFQNREDLGLQDIAANHGQIGRCRLSSGFFHQARHLDDIVVLCGFHGGDAIKVGQSWLNFHQGDHAGGAGIMHLNHLTKQAVTLINEIITQ